jgi:AcrR family transcriptional regulator
MSPAAVFTPDDADRLVLDAADTLFYGRGISGVGMAEIRDASGVSLRRIYGMYPSKRDLVAAWLNDRHDRWMTWFTETVQRHVARGTDPVLAAFDAIREWRRSPGYRGCAFINAIAEPMEIDDQHRAIVADHKRSLVGHLAALATRKRAHTPTWFADALAVLIDGAIVQSAIFGNDKPINAARKAAARLLETMP